MSFRCVVSMWLINELNWFVATSLQYCNLFPSCYMYLQWITCRFKLLSLSCFSPIAIIMSLYSLSSYSDSLQAEYQIQASGSYLLPTTLCFVSPTGNCPSHPSHSRNPTLKTKDILKQLTILWMIFFISRIKNQVDSDLAVNPFIVLHIPQFHPTSLHTW